MVSTILGSSGLTYFDPIEAFADKSLKQYIATKCQGKDTSPNPLFNGHLADGHFSPLGCEVWAQTVGHRLSLILERRKIEEECFEGRGASHFTPRKYPMRLTSAGGACWKLSPPKPR